ncbi:MAG TPA: LPS export ABC transporter periplasmic protein LptC [Rhizobacter sp.]|jgi:lipopolysaccharide export system protein LptC|nr:LPS export ABC transporter periplasmic protein LptC [Rhizobacter sp.]
MDVPEVLGVDDPAVLSPPVAPAASHFVAQPWRWRVLEWVSAYLPLLLMALLALGTWWLVKNTPMSDEARTEAPLRHEPDYEMHVFAVQRFTPEGPLRAQIEGDALRHYPDSDTVEIDNVRMRAIGPDGRVTRATARRAISNGAATEVQLLGGAEIVREAMPGDEAINFRSEFLHAFLDTERVRSHLPVTVTRGGTEVRADGMEYNHLDRLIRFGGRMRASFPPKTPP